jgi:hypothetical protein
MMTCRPSPVSTARFLTARAIDLKTLYIWTTRLPDLKNQMLVRSDSWFGDLGAKPENTKCAITI